MFTLAEDQDTQKYGMIYVMWHVGEFRNDDRQRRKWEILSEIVFANRWMPVPCRGFHLCVDNGPFKEVLREVHQITADALIRPYLRVHKAPKVGYIKHQLKTYGIPVHRFPLTGTGALTTKNQSKWVKKRKYKEGFEDVQVDNAGGFKPFVDMPSHKDVTLGRGRPTEPPPGNIKLGFIVDEYLDEYRKANWEQRASIRWRVVQQIRAAGGRFLRRSRYSWWVEVDGLEANERVSSTFANALAARSREDITRSPK